MNVDAFEKLRLEMKAINNEIELKTHSSLMVHFLEMTTDLLCIINDKGEFVALSSSWEKELGYSRAEMIGQNFLNFVVTPDKVDTKGAFRRYNFENDSLKGYYYNRYKKREGGYAWLRWEPEENQAYKNTGFILGVAVVIKDPKTLAELDMQHE